MIYTSALKQDRHQLLAHLKLKVQDREATQLQKTLFFADHHCKETQITVVVKYYILY